MATITTRAGKGSPLTNAEVDANFTNLNAELLTKQDALGFTPANKAGDTFTGAVLTSNANGFTANSAAKLWTDSSRGRLDLYEGAAATKSLRVMNANGYGIMGMTSAENLELWTNGVARVTIGGSTGNVGIGGSPSTGARIRVVGAGDSSEVARIESGTLASYLIVNQTDDPAVNSNRSGISLHKNNVSGGSISVDVNATGRGAVFYDAWGLGEHAFYINSVERFKLNSSGAVGFSSSYGTAGQLLKSGGSSAAPSWGALTSGEVTTALGFTPYNATNPSGYITSSGSITGNAATATALQTARSINLVSFNGTADIEIARVRSLDDRAIAPADGSTRYVTSFFGSWANNNTTPYADALLFRSYTDSSGGADNLLMLRKDALGLRVWQQDYGSATAFSNYKDVAWTDGTNASGTWGISVTGSAATLTTGRTIALTGDVTYTSGSFNGSANVTGTATLANSGVTAGTYTKVTVDAKGRVTTGASLASADLPTYTGTITSSQVTTALGFTPGYKSVPPAGTKTSSYTLTTADIGEYVQIGSGGSITIPDAVFAEGDVISLFNNTAGTVTITCSITTAYIGGTDSDKATMTLAARGVATILFISGTICVVTGNVA